MEQSTQEDLTDRMDALCNHYGMTPSRNTKGVAHENGAIEGPHGHLKRAIADALIMRGSHDFEDLAAYRRFIDEVAGRTGARNAKRIDVERTSLKPLPARRTTDFEGITVRVTSSGGFLLRKVFYTVPSRLIGHQLRVRIYDDRLDLFLGVSFPVTLPAAPAQRATARISMWSTIIMSSIRCAKSRFAKGEPTAGSPPAKRPQVRLWRNDCGCEAELAAQLEEDLRQKRRPDIAALTALFAPLRGSLPGVEVQLADLSAYDQLLGNTPMTQEVAA